MAVHIRLRRTGRSKKPSYRVVVADARAARDGRFIEVIGHYSPLTTPATLEIKLDKAAEWIKKGAQPSNTVHLDLAHADASRPARRRRLRRRHQRALDLVRRELGMPGEDLRRAPATTGAANDVPESWM